MFYATLNQIFQKNIDNVIAKKDMGGIKMNSSIFTAKSQTRKPMLQIELYTLFVNSQLLSVSQYIM